MLPIMGALGGEFLYFSESQGTGSGGLAGAFRFKRRGFPHCRRIAPGSGVTGAAQEVESLSLGDANGFGQSFLVEPAAQVRLGLSVLPGGAVGGFTGRDSDVLLPRRLALFLGLEFGFQRGHLTEEKIDSGVQKFKGVARARRGCGGG